MKAHEFDRVVRKFGMATREGRDLLAWFEYEGRVITRTRRSRGAKDIPFRLVRQQLKLDENQLREAVRCDLTLDGYIAILQARGLIG